MSRIPEDVCLDIFLRLPVKSLLTCKCVCKTWFELISNPSFVKLHLYLTTHENNPNLMLKTYEPRMAMYVCTSIILGKLDDVAVDIEYPLKTSGRFSYLDFQWVGSCNGLVCFWCHTRRRYCLWNPATKEYKKIPKLQLKGYMKDYNQGVCAFGYDCKNDDYKIIYVVKFNGTNDSSLVGVYNLGTNSWKISRRVLDGFPSRLFIGVLVDGNFHWLNQTHDKIISLEISDEKFEELEKPEELLEKKHRSITIGVLERCLALVVNFQVQFEVWVMQEYGIRESWTKSYKIADNRIQSDVPYTRLVCSFRNGEVLVLLAAYKLIVYDTKHASTREQSMLDIAFYKNALNYFESLVSLNSDSYVGQKKKKIKFKINPFKIFCT